MKFRLGKRTIAISGKKPTTEYELTALENSDSDAAYEGHFIIEPLTSKELIELRDLINDLVLQ